VFQGESSGSRGLSNAREMQLAKMSRMMITSKSSENTSFMTLPWNPVISTTSSSSSPPPGTTPMRLSAPLAPRRMDLITLDFMSSSCSFVLADGEPGTFPVMDALALTMLLRRIMVGVGMALS